MWHHLWRMGPDTLIISQDNAPWACLSANLMEAFSQWRFPSHLPPGGIGLAKVKAAPSPPCEFETHLQWNWVGICISLNFEANIDLQQALTYNLSNAKWRLMDLVTVLSSLKCAVLLVAMGDIIYLALSVASISCLYVTMRVFEWLPLLTKIIVSGFDQYLFDFSHSTFQ